MTEFDVIQKARSFVAGIDGSKIGTDLGAYLQCANATIRKEDLGKGESGFAIKREDDKYKYVITVNSLEAEVRQRFTVCHELGHIVLGLPSSHGALPLWSFAKRDANEVLCDVFAAELLMPYAAYRARMAKQEPSIDVIEGLAENFRVSFPAAASRYASLADFPCAYVVMEGGIVRYAPLSTSLRRTGARIPPKSPMPPGSVAARVRSAGTNEPQTDQVAQDVWLDEWDKGYDFWEMARRYAHFDTTMSLLWCSEDELPQREVDRFGKKVADDDDGGLSELTGELPWPGKRKRK
jgi:Zn-dependent peptidase ImmA (M78 family)